MQSKGTDIYKLAFNTTKCSLLFSSMQTEDAFKDSDSKNLAPVKCMETSSFLFNNS